MGLQGDRWVDRVTGGLTGSGLQGDMWVDRVTGGLTG